MFKKLIKAIFRRFKELLSKNSIIPFWKKILIKHLDSSIHKIHIGSYKIYFNRPGEFLHAINEIYEQEIYAFRSQDIKPTIIDCGSNIGVSVLYFAEKYPGAIITAFEPDSENFELLTRNINENKLKNVMLYKKAIWIHNNGIKFTENEGQSSTIDEQNGNAFVETQRLSEILNTNVSLLKIDIEGAEGEVLIDCKQQLDKVQNIFVEYHGHYGEESKLLSILGILKDANFKIYIKEAANIHNSPFKREKTKYKFDVQLNIFGYKQ